MSRIDCRRRQCEGEIDRAKVAQRQMVGRLGAVGMIDFYLRSPAKVISPFTIHRQNWAILSNRVG